LGLLLKARVNQAILTQVVFNSSECHKVTAGDKPDASKNFPQHLSLTEVWGRKVVKRILKDFFPLQVDHGANNYQEVKLAWMHYQAEFKTSRQTRNSNFETT